MDGEQLYRKVQPDMLMGREATKEIKDPETGKTLVKRGPQGHPPGGEAPGRMPNRPHRGVRESELIGRYAAADLADPVTAELIVGLNQPITEDAISKMRAAGVGHVPVLYIDGVTVSSSFRDTLELDKVEETDEAIVDIYRKLRPSNPPTLEVARTFFHNLFFSSDEHYDLSAVGRLKMNLRLGLDVPEDERTLQPRRHHVRGQGAHPPQGHRGPGGRHRPPGQPPGARRGRAAWKTSIASAWCAWSGPSRNA